MLGLGRSRQWAAVSVAHRGSWLRHPRLVRRSSAARRKRSMRMLADKDRIFTNLYGQDDWTLAGRAGARRLAGHQGRSSSAVATGSPTRSRARACAAAAAPVSRPRSNGPSCPRSMTAARTSCSSTPTSPSPAPARTARSCGTIRIIWSRAACSPAAPWMRISPIIYVRGEFIRERQRLEARGAAGL